MGSASGRDDGASSLAFRRERAVAILSEGFARNRLSMEEFERRVSAAQAAGSLAELDRLIDDIPEELHAISIRSGSGSPGAARSGGSSGADRPGSGRLADQEQPVQGIMMSRTLRGDWLRSRVVTVRTVMSSTALDFRDVELPAGELEVRIASVMSTVVITVPEGLPVQTDVTPVLGEVKEGRSVRTVSSRTSGPWLHVTGTTVLGEVKIRAR